MEVPENIRRYYPKDYYSCEKPLCKRSNWAIRVLKKERAKYLLGQRSPIGFLMAWRKARPEYFEWLAKAHLKPESKVLDVGCGAGELLLRLHNEGFSNLTGIDPYLKEPLKYAKGLTILNREYTDIRGPYDLIMSHHSFEHMADPTDVLAVFSRNLATNGRIVIRTPIAGTHAWKTSGVNWVQLDAPRHLFVHTTTSMGILAERNGLEILDVTFDSNELQFWGSEQYRRDIPLYDSRSFLVDPAASIFTSEDMELFRLNATKLNQQQDGDSARFLLCKA